jgi:hypothetical protein
MSNKVLWPASSDPTVTSYVLQSSPDNVTWSPLTTIANNISNPALYDTVLARFFYVDAGGITTTWYRLASVNGVGQSLWSAPFEAAQSLPSVVGYGGATTLAGIRLNAQREADMEADPHVSTDEWNAWINASRFELYDLLITRFGEDYYTARAQMTTDGNDYLPLPDGSLYGGAPPFYKSTLVEALTGAGVMTPVTLLQFNLREKNRYNFPLYATTAGFMLPRYRFVGDRIIFTPKPATGIVVQVWYAPKLAPLVNDTDGAEDWSGWLEYAVVDAAIKALGKQERDASLLMSRKKDLKDRIELAAQNRNPGEPNTVSETNTDSLFGVPGMTGLYNWMA